MAVLTAPCPFPLDWSRDPSVSRELPPLQKSHGREGGAKNGGLLVDKNEYDRNNELIVYVPTSHVLMHDADMLGIQLLTYYR